MKTIEPSDCRALYLALGKSRREKSTIARSNFTFSLQAQPRNRATGRIGQSDRPLEGRPASSRRGKAEGTGDEASARNADEAARVGGQGGEFEGVGDEVG